MKGVDTNVLARLVVGDYPEHADRARRYIERHARGDRSFFVNRVVLCELVWVLLRVYRYPDSEVASLLDRLLMNRDFAVENARAASFAIAMMPHGYDFADTYMAATNRILGCTTTATFDRRAARLPLFESV